MKQRQSEHCESWRYSHGSQWLMRSWCNVLSTVLKPDAANLAIEVANDAAALARLRGVGACSALPDREAGEPAKSSFESHATSARAPPPFAEFSRFEFIGTIQFSCDFLPSKRSAAVAVTISQDTASTKKIQPPKHWPATAKSAMLHVISLPQYAAAYTRRELKVRSSRPCRAGTPEIRKKLEIGTTEMQNRVWDL
jgi:hypothetical protein